MPLRKKEMNSRCRQEEKLQMQWPCERRWTWILRLPQQLRSLPPAAFSLPGSVTSDHMTEVAHIQEESSAWKGRKEGGRGRGREGTAERSRRVSFVMTGRRRTGVPPLSDPPPVCSKVKRGCDDVTREGARDFLITESSTPVSFMSGEWHEGDMKCLHTGGPLQKAGVVKMEDFSVLFSYKLTEIKANIFKMSHVHELSQ